MASKKKGGRSLVKQLRAAHKASLEDYAKALSTMLAQMGEQDTTTIAHLPKGDMLKGFVEEWVPRIMPGLVAASDYIPAGHGLCQRLMIFAREEGAQEWSWANINSLDLDSATKFSEIEWIIDQYVAERTDPGIGVWIYPGGKGGITTFYVRHDEHNEMAVVVPSSGKMQIVVGMKRLALMGELMFRGQTKRLLKWEDVINQYVNVFVRAGIKDVNELLRKWGLPGDLSKPQIIEFCRAVFNPEHFLPFVMGAGRFHARDALLEAHVLGNAVHVERERSKAEIEELRQAGAKDAERLKQRMLKDIQAAQTQAKGARALAQRLQTENAQLNARLAGSRLNAAEPDNTAARLHQGFASLLAPALAAG